MHSFVRNTRNLIATAALTASAALATTAGASPAVAEPVAIEAQIAESVWSTAGLGAEDRLTDLLGSAESSGSLPVWYDDSVDRFMANIAKRESDRQTQITEVGTELDEHIANAGSDRSGVELSKALAKAVELQLLMDDNQVFFGDPRINTLIQDADKSAHSAEANGDWIIANELYYRLDVLLDRDGKYGGDVDRLGKRLTMIRLYAPQRLWELRNTRRIVEGEDPLPPYNPYGDDFHTKLAGINAQMIWRAMLRSATSHVQRASRTNPDGVSMAKLIDGGLEALETMATTIDLQRAFPGLRDAGARTAFLGDIRTMRIDLRNDASVDSRDMRQITNRVLETNRETVRIMDEAILHEFGNGSMEQMDDYTAIIWPDELARFRRSTQGEFTGVGIQIQLDELQNIKVVTPLEGTPAQRAGIRSDDIIKRVDGISAIGLGLDQAVEVITGKAGTPVTLTVEREMPNGDKSQLDFRLIRKKIDLVSVKGWKKTGPGDADWDYFIDRDAHIGYIRLTGFTEDTTREFDRAISTMRRTGLGSLILDLRYNPGGLLDQAVKISNRFVDDGLIVRTETATGMVTDEQRARAVSSGKSLGDLPVVVLINEGSASASEIVSGAIQAGAQHGKVRALLIGQRSFGKGSVQNVFALSGGMAAMKLTTQYYKIDAPRLIHREPGSTEWGIEPDLAVEMLPSQQQQALLLRRESDVLPMDEHGNIILSDDRPDPDKLLTDGIDLQVNAALVILQAQTGSAVRTARRNEPQLP